MPLLPKKYHGGNAYFKLEKMQVDILRFGTHITPFIWFFNTDLLKNNFQILKIEFRCGRVQKL